RNRLSLAGAGTVNVRIGTLSPRTARFATASRVAPPIDHDAHLEIVARDAKSGGASRRIVRIRVDDLAAILSKHAGAADGVRLDRMRRVRMRRALGPGSQAFDGQRDADGALGERGPVARDVAAAVG